jgi:predicted MFS family arabinose efflux permease
LKLPRRLEALRERNFRLFFIGQATSQLGTGMVGVALSFAVLGLTGSVSDLGLVLAAQTVPLVLFLIVGGTVADRLPRRAVMLVSDSARCLTQGLLAALLLTHHAQLWHLLALQFLGGTATAFFLPAVTGLTPQVVSNQRLQEANALRSLAGSSGSIAGPVIAGVLVAAVGPGWALACDAASFAVSAFFLSRLRLPAHDAISQSSLLRDLVEGWHEFRSRTWLVLANVHAAIANVTMLAPFFVIGPAVAKRYLGGVGAWALIAACFGVGLVIGGLISLTLRPRRPMLVGLGATITNVPLLVLLAVHASAIAAAACAIPAGATLTFLNTVWETTLQKHIPARLLSRVVAYDWFAALVFQPVGYVVAGLVAAHVLGLSGTLWLGAVIGTVSTVVIVSLPSIRTLEAEPQVPIADPAAPA